MVKSLVGAATRYISGRNAIQTVYWKSTDANQAKFVKVSKTVNFGPGKRSEVPEHVKKGQTFNM